MQERQRRERDRGARKTEDEGRQQSERYTSERDRVARKIQTIEREERETEN